MRKDFRKLIEKVIQNLDWDTIFEIHKAFKFGIGEGSEVIPGLKRKIFSEDLTKNDVKSELKALLRFVINNDISKFSYGPWMLFWFNQDWDIMFEDPEVDDLTEAELEEFKVDSRLEVIFSPQRICLTVDAKPEVNGDELSSEEVILTKMLKRALKSENYELAGKIQEVLDSNNSESTTDK
jgi:hypothetical protein